MKWIKCKVIQFNWKKWRNFFEVQFPLFQNMCWETCEKYFRNLRNLFGCWK